MWVLYPRTPPARRPTPTRSVLRQGRASLKCSFHLSRFSDFPFVDGHNFTRGAVIYPLGIERFTPNFREVSIKWRGSRPSDPSPSPDKGQVRHSSSTTPNNLVTLSGFSSTTNGAVRNTVLSVVTGRVRSMRPSLRNDSLPLNHQLKHALNSQYWPVSPNVEVSNSEAQVGFVERN